MRTKIIAATCSLLSYLLAYLTSNQFLIPITFFFIHLVYGILKSHVNSRKLLNEVPNSLRILLASISGVLFYKKEFLSISLAFFFFLGAILLNDEYQRRAFDSLLKGRRGGSLVFLGIDGSGKTTHSIWSEEWLRGRGYFTRLEQFHKYIFVERLSRKKESGKTLTPKRGGNPFRPLASLIDNIIFLLATSFGSGLEGRVVIYDRFIWSTYIKYEALGYPVKPLRLFYMMFRPRYAVVLDVPVSRSIEVIKKRPEHIRYTKVILSKERQMYLEIARKFSYPVINTSREKKEVESDLESILSKFFPEVR